jgi:predicted metal-dependent HD superfamily phosphohydrolase
MHDWHEFRFIPKRMQSFCKARWDWLMNRGTINTSVSKKWFDIVSTHYQESQRHYHTLEHIEELLSLSEKYSSSLSFQDHVEYSIWFHEYVTYSNLLFCCLHLV